MHCTFQHPVGIPVRKEDRIRILNELQHEIPFKKQMASPNDQQQHNKHPVGIPVGKEDRIRILNKLQHEIPFKKQMASSNDQQQYKNHPVAKLLTKKVNKAHSAHCNLPTDHLKDPNYAFVDGPHSVEYIQQIVWQLMGWGKSLSLNSNIVCKCVCVCVLQLAKNGNGLQALSLTSYVLHF